MSTPELQRERAHLAAARANLERMRASAAALNPGMAGDWVSAAYLASTLDQRVAALTADPHATLFFGRIDTDLGTPETFHIGRRHIADEAGDPVVVDWRADVSTPFYRATRDDPMGVVRRRRFGVDRGELTAYEDEHLSDAAEVTGSSAILAAEIERPRVGPMRDIVATIQPEQDLVVRADLETSVCVQGAPGTGKTAVGLHRAAWLLYAHRERLARSGMLVIGPNRAFLGHIGAVLPALGEVEVRHTTVAELLGHVPVRGQDTPAVAALKGDARMAELLRRAVWGQVRAAEGPLIYVQGSRRFFLTTPQVQSVLDELQARGVRYDAARGMLPQRLAHAVLTQMERRGDSPDDRVQDAVARSRIVRSYVQDVWPQREAATVVASLLSDPEALAAHAGDLLTPEEVASLVWARPARTARSARFSEADLALIDEVSDLLNRTPSLGHVVLDEAQDLSAMQLRAVGRRCSTGSLTVLGDIAQGTTPWSTGSWTETMGHLGHPEFELEELLRGFRVPAAVIEYAARLLPAIAPNLAAPQSVRTNPGELHVLSVASLAAGLVTAVHQAMGHEGSIGVIVPDARLAELSAVLGGAGVDHVAVTSAVADDPEHPHRVQLIPATVAKGLEYDRVVVVEPAEIAAAEADVRTGLRRLYVVLTRAVSGLTVLHTQPLPPLLT